MATTYGLHTNSALNQLDYFHTTEGLIPDIVHDILEGVLPLAIKHLLKRIVDETLISVHDINKRIDEFEFGSVEAANKLQGNITSAQLNSNDPIKLSGMLQICGIILYDIRIVAPYMLVFVAYVCIIRTTINYMCIFAIIVS